MISSKAVWMFILLFAIPCTTRAQWIRQHADLHSVVLVAIDFGSSALGCAAGYTFNDSAGEGRVVYTTDGGSTWMPALLPDSIRTIISVQFIDGQKVYAAGSRVVPAAAHGSVHSVAPPGTFLPRRGLDVLPHFTGLGDPDAAASSRGVFMRSSDGGRTWSIHGTLPDSVNDILSVSFPDSQTGYVSAYGYPGVPSWEQKARVLKTTNGGSSWSNLKLPVQISELRQVAFRDADRGFAVGYRYIDSGDVPVIIRTLDGGMSWDMREFSDSVYPALNGIAILDDSSCIAVGHQGGSGCGTRTLGSLAYRTTNFGRDWLPAAIDFDSAAIFGVKFREATGMVFGAILHGNVQCFDPWVQRPFVARTTDGGTSWTKQRVMGIDTGGAFGGALPSALDAYLCGYTGGLLDFSITGGFILHATDGGVSFAGRDPANRPSDIELFQNVPNPFNPSTAIEYSISKQGAVRLDLFDILGRHIETLVSEDQLPGAHVVRWHAAHQPGGVYFYRLAVGGLAKTRKLVLLK